MSKQASDKSGVSEIVGDTSEPENVDDRNVTENDSPEITEITYISDISEYLSQYVCKQENMSEFLGIVSRLTNSSSTLLFRSCSKNNFVFIDSCRILEFKHTPVLEPIELVRDLSIHDSPSECGLIVDDIVGTTCLIPIITHEYVGGILCLIGKEYTQYTGSSIAEYITLLQIIVDRDNLRAEYTRLATDQLYKKDMFTDDMSNQIRTPLNGVIGFGQLLMRTELDSNQKKYVTSMNQCGIQLMQIINDILDFSKLSSGKMSTNTECFSICEVRDSIHNVLGQRIDEKRQKFVFNYDTVPEYIVMDKQKLTQILINLVSNAHKFSGEGETILVTASHDKQGFLNIDIVDTGVGICEDDQCKLFNAFAQIQDSVCKTGTGLGLAISRKLCELLGGNISVKSSLGVGTTFSIHVLCSAYEEGEQSITNGYESMMNKCILVVDDDVNTRIVIRKILCEWQMIPVVCASALEAISIVSDSYYDFVVGIVGDTNDHELTTQLKHISPFLPLVSMSSVVSSRDFDHVIDKPINKVQLFSSIQKSISGNTEISTRSSNSSTVSNKNCKILISEDTPFNRTMITQMLNSLGYMNVHSTENGQLAYNELSRALTVGDPYEILLLDLRIPVMDGYDVINTIKKNGWFLPTIIVITASVMEDDKKLCVSLGVKHFITKPIDLSELRKVLLRVV
jgi:signal transduction histidine kinase/CheY-like chemotaxis protein